MFQPLTSFSFFWQNFGCIYLLYLLEILVISTSLYLFTYLRNRDNFLQDKNPWHNRPCIKTLQLLVNTKYIAVLGFYELSFCKYFILYNLVLFHPIRDNFFLWLLYFHLYSSYILCCSYIMPRGQLFHESLEYIYFC